MAGVFIDIPGIGNVEAKNAATEETLREILKALQAGNKAGTKPGSGAGTGAGAGAGAGATTASGKAAASLATKMGAAAMSAVKFGGAVVGAVKAVGEFAGALSNIIGDMANVGDSIQSAANQIPLLGGFFAPIAGAIEKSVGAFQKSTEAGATFGGSVNNMARAASGAGMTLDKFANLIAQNGDSLRLLGGTTEDGANRFAQLSKQLRTGGYMSSLNDLGFTTEEVNQGMANYIGYLGRTGKIGNKSNAELAAGSAKYLKEMDMLAKITGETRKEQEEARKKLLNDAQFQAKVSNMSAEAGEAFANTVNTLPPGLRDVAKDIMVTGTATTEESQRFTAMMPKSAALMQEYAQITERGGTITQAMQNNLNNILAQEGAAAKQQYRDIGKYSQEMSGAYMATVTASNIQRDAVKKAAEAQERANNGTDKLAAASEAAKRRLAELSNGFTMMLANSGMLDSLMSLFELVAKVVQTVVFPVFSAFGAILKPVVSILSAVLMPIFTALGERIKTLLLPFQFIAYQLNRLTGDFGLLSKITNLLLIPFNLITDVMQFLFKGLVAVSDTLEDMFLPVINLVGRILGSVGSFLQDNFLSAIKSVSDYFTNAFKPVLEFVTPIFKAVGDVFDKISDSVGNFLRGFNSLGDIVHLMGLQFKGLGLNLKEMWYAIKDFIPGLADATPEERAALAKEKEALLTEQTEFDKKHEKQAEENLKKQKEQEAKIAKEREARDRQFYGDKTARDKAATEAAASEKNSKNYNDSLSLLPSEAKQQGSAWIKDKPSSTSAAESGKTAMEKDAEKKSAAESKRDEEFRKAMEEEKPFPNQSTPNSSKTTQESPETLLASLNSKMDQLIRVNSKIGDINERQLTVQQSMSNDLFASV
jgi:hypothetical protein